MVPERYIYSCRCRSRMTKMVFKCRRRLTMTNFGFCCSNVEFCFNNAKIVRSSFFLSSNPNCVVVQGRQVLFRELCCSKRQKMFFERSSRSLSLEDDKMSFSSFVIVQQRLILFFEFHCLSKNGEGFYRISVVRTRQIFLRFLLSMQ